MENENNSNFFSPWDHDHDEVLGGHEGQLGRDSILDDLRVDNDSLEDVLQSLQDGVRRQKRFRQSDSPKKMVSYKATIKIIQEIN